MVGSAAALAGVTRMTVSLAVISISPFLSPLTVSVRIDGKSNIRYADYGINPRIEMG